MKWIRTKKMTLTLSLNTDDSFRIAGAFNAYKSIMPTMGKMRKFNAMIFKLWSNSFTRKQTNRKKTYFYSICWMIKVKYSWAVYLYALNFGVCRAMATTAKQRAVYYSDSEMELSWFGWGDNEANHLNSFIDIRIRKWRLHGIHSNQLKTLFWQT